MGRRIITDRVQAVFPYHAQPMMGRRILVAVAAITAVGLLLLFFSLSSSLLVAVVVVAVMVAVALVIVRLLRAIVFFISFKRIAILAPCTVGGVTP